MLFSYTFFSCNTSTVVWLQSAIWLRVRRLVPCCQVFPVRLGKTYCSLGVKRNACRNHLYQKHFWEKKMFWNNVTQLQWKICWEVVFLLLIIIQLHFYCSHYLTRKECLKKHFFHLWLYAHIMEERTLTKDGKKDQEDSVRGKQMSIYTVIQSTAIMCLQNVLSAMTHAYYNCACPKTTTCSK